MARIKQLLERGTRIYPLTSPDAVVFTGGQDLTDKLQYIYENYETYSDLVDNLTIEFSVPNKEIELKLDDVILSTISTDNFAISGVLDSAGYNANTGILSMSFTDGNSVNIDLNQIISSILQDYANEVQALRNLHVTLSESDYEALRVKNSNTFYYTYEDDEEIEEPEEPEET